VYGLSPSMDSQDLRVFVTGQRARCRNHLNVGIIQNQNCY